MDEHQIYNDLFTDRHRIITGMDKFVDYNIVNRLVTMYECNYPRELVYTIPRSHLFNVGSKVICLFIPAQTACMGFPLSSEFGEMTCSIISRTYSTYEMQTCSSCAVGEAPTEESHAVGGCW